MEALPLQAAARSLEFGANPYSASASTPLGLDERPTAAPLNPIWESFIAQTTANREVANHRHTEEFPAASKHTYVTMLLRALHRSTN